LSATMTGMLTGAPTGYVLGQVVLGTSVYFALSMLANRPLLNPIQAVVVTFYWWIGIGPAVIAGWNVLAGRPHLALGAQVSSMEALWIVAPGLLLYAICANWALYWFSRTGKYARFLLPTGNTYRPSVLISYLLVAAVSSLVLLTLQLIGVQGQEEVNYLGGTKTTIWWVGVIAAAGSVAPFVQSAAMTALATPIKTVPLSTRIVIAFTVGQTVLLAAFGGWKSPIAILGAYYACAIVARRQRPPWLFLVGGAVLFLFVIAPFVSLGRNTALSAGATDSKDRKEVFASVLEDPEGFLPSKLDEVDPGLLFRGVAPLAGELTRRNGFIEGEWHGETLIWGLEVLTPRVLLPEKRDSNIGNFFAQTVGADIGVAAREDDFNNIAISIPFEFVGNYGWFAGVLSFGLIGIFWSLLCTWMLSPARLSNHPLTPFLAVATMAMEGSLGVFLAGMRNLLVPLTICFLIDRLLRQLRKSFGSSLQSPSSLSPSQLPIERLPTI